jgi:DNA-binding MarR family transcriptional regulator
MDSAAADASDLAARVRVSVTRLTRRLRAQRADTGVSLTHLSAMATLYSCGPMTPSKLAAAERVRPPSVTRVLAALQEAGLIRRLEDAGDRRQSIIMLTDVGIDHLHAEAAVTERWPHERLADLSEPDRETLRRAVNIIDGMAEA